MSSSGPIGVLDSGVGGLSILSKIHHLLPRERLLYVADSAHAPYGWKGADFIRERCERLMDFFMAHEAKAVVLACNTATAAAVSSLRERHALPIIGVEPAVKPAAEQSCTGVVGVLATAGTIESDKFIILKSRFTPQVEIITRACPGLVEAIERPDSDPDVLAALLRGFVRPLVDKGADTLVLGCTHYSLIMREIATVAGEGVTVMDTGFAVARELQRRLGLAGLLEEDGPGSVSFHSSGEPHVQEAIIGRYWGSAVRVESLEAAFSGRITEEQNL